MAEGRRRKNQGRGAGMAARALAVVTLLAGASACDDLLSVDTPGQVAAGDLEVATVATLLVNSAISDLECAWNQYTAGSSGHSDEYMSSTGNLALRHWATRRFESNDVSFGQGECGGAVFPLFTPLHTARFHANDVYRRLTSEEFAEVPDLPGKMATMRAHSGFAMVALGEGFCEMTIPDEEGVPGPLLTPAQVLERAETHFSEAITLADQAGNASIRNMALVGRARVRLALGNTTGVIADAELVPAGFQRMATRDGTGSRRFNYNFERYNAPSGFRQNATIATHYRELTIAPDGRPTEGDGVADPRVEVFHTGGNGTDGVTPHWVNTKYTSQETDIPIATYREAQLFLAEAHVREGDIDLAIDIIDARRNELGLPTVQYGPDPDEALELIIEERRRDLFLEGGHRLYDMLRFRGTAHQIPFLGEPGSIHPDGIDQTGFEYGSVTCYPLPDVERSGNPNIP